MYEVNVNCTQELKNIFATAVLIIELLTYKTYLYYFYSSKIEQSARM